MNDNNAYRFPVSIKAVIIHDFQIPLLKNERDEWELPGGKLELGEDPKQCLVREVAEETNLHILPKQILDPYVYNVLEVCPVLIVPFLCVVDGLENLCLSNEHKEIRLFRVDDLDGINLPIGYRRSISIGIDILALSRGIR